MSTSREELERRLAELRAANEAATSWGAAVGARLEEIKDIERQLSRLAATPKAGVDMTLPEIPDDDADFSPDLARKIIERYQQIVRSLTLPSVLGGVDQPSSADGQQCNEQSGKQLSPALEIIEQNCWDLRCVDIPTGAGDADIGWQIIEHHMAPPKERVVGYGNSPIEALNDALAGGQS